jgi:hypothetical protein
MVRGVPTGEGGTGREGDPRIIENFVFFLENFQKLLKKFAKIGVSPPIIENFNKFSKKFSTPARFLSLRDTPADSDAKQFFFIVIIF